MHHAFLFVNRSGTRMRVLIYDGLRILLAVRKFSLGHFVWCNGLNG
ncbi:IS66 family insertion sequence element accessory protein TnpB [Herbaspirillum sp. GCM10030257]